MALDPVRQVLRPATAVHLDQVVLDPADPAVRDMDPEGQAAQAMVALVRAVLEAQALDVLADLATAVPEVLAQEVLAMDVPEAHPGHHHHPSPDAEAEEQVAHQTQL